MGIPITTDLLSLFLSLYISVRKQNESVILSYENLSHRLNNSLFFAIVDTDFH